MSVREAWANFLSVLDCKLQDITKAAEKHTTSLVSGLRDGSRSSKNLKFCTFLSVRHSGINNYTRKLTEKSSSRSDATARSVLHSAGYQRGPRAVIGGTSTSVLLEESRCNKKILYLDLVVIGAEVAVCKRAMVETVLSVRADGSD